MSDALIQKLAANGGVLMISFGSTFLHSGYPARQQEFRDSVEAALDVQGFECYSKEGVRTFEQARKAHPIGTLEEVVYHIDHAVALAGADHLGLDSDVDGVTSLQDGLQDASMFPNLVAELLRWGYSNEQPRGILGGNALRVWEAVEKTVADLEGLTRAPQQ